MGAVRAFFLLFILSVLSLSAWSQQGVIMGKVIDAESGETLPGAVVTIPGKEGGVVTDLEGYFKMVNLDPGTYELSVYYISYKTTGKIVVVVERDGVTNIEVELEPDNVLIEEVKVTAKANRESETVLLMERKNAILPTQSVSSREMSRKGVGDAEAAVAQVAGVSTQEGVKNVFVRGLGDRYNVTLLNGFPIPSEDPEYKNISLSFFGTDVIQSVGVNKVFNSLTVGDVGGAAINISSKELIGDGEFGLDCSFGGNFGVIGERFVELDGVNYMGFARTDKPADQGFSFANELQPRQVKLPVKHGFGFSGGMAFPFSGGKNPLSFFIVGAHDVDYTFSREHVKGSVTDGTIYRDQEGEKYSQSASQLLLANVDFRPLRHHALSYNFMMVHASDQYVGHYSGLDGEKFQSSETLSGQLWRQQANDNLLLVNQLFSNWQVTKDFRLYGGVSYNMIRGREPDRRENCFSDQGDNRFVLSGSNRQKRFFSELDNGDLNATLQFAYTLKDRHESGNSEVKVGYSGRFAKDDFHAVEYNFQAVGGLFDIEQLNLDDLYNQQGYAAGTFTMARGDRNAYQVDKRIHTGYAQLTYQLTPKLIGDLGFRFDRVDMTVSHQVQHTQPGGVQLLKSYYLPSLNLKYTFNTKHSLRLGVSQTYTLPQSKEISPYQYVNIGFASQGNPNIKPSNNYNADLRWEFYPSNSELVSVTAFYKYIERPMGRVDMSNSAGLLSYDNVSQAAWVTGVELEVRKNLYSAINLEAQQIHRLSFGLNASYIYTSMETQILNTPTRRVMLEGAAPFIGNVDLSYTFQRKQQQFICSLLFSYLSDRVHTIGAGDFNDIIEKGVPELNFVTSYRFNKYFSMSLKATNLLNPHFRLVREASSVAAEKVVLSDYQKGMSMSLGLSFSL